MRELIRRLEKLEQQAATGDCTCSGQSVLVHFAGDPPAQPKYCRAHGSQQVVAWPLPRSPLDA